MYFPVVKLVRMLISTRKIWVSLILVWLHWAFTITVWLPKINFFTTSYFGWFGLILDHVLSQIRYLFFFFFVNELLLNEVNIDFFSSIINIYPLVTFFFTGEWCLLTKCLKKSLSMTTRWPAPYPSPYTLLILLPPSPPHPPLTFFLFPTCSHSSCSLPLSFSLSPSLAPSLFLCLSLYFYSPSFSKLPLSLSPSPWL